MLKLPEETTFITASPNLSFADEDAFTDYLCNEEINGWPSLVLAITDEGPIEIGIKAIAQSKEPFISFEFFNIHE